jgi:shikimate kinase
MVKYLINEEYDVKDAGAAKGFARGERREDYADPWRETGNVVLIGLPGSGRAELARLLAARTDKPVLTPPDAKGAAEVLQARGAIIVLEDSLVDDPAVQPLIHGAGKVFYLMADTRLLSGRVAGREGLEDTEELWRRLSARLAQVEPTFYGVLHFILQGAQSPEELVDDALEKIGY